MKAIDVRMEGVGKRYRLGTERSADTFWALKDIDLEVPRGTSFGVIGPNGAGKSTLMKLLAGISAPTTGRITIDGALSALIEVGSGFHPELTGRENVYLSGSILGMRRRDIAARFDEIVGFAGVERFVDTPVKWYSSGMYVRLGFAIAAHLQPDILLVDEVLAVGDAEFQAKCLQRIRDLQEQGVTILFISHDLTAVEQLCDAAMLLRGGVKVAEGLPADVVSAYHRQLVSAARSAEGDAPPGGSSPALKLTNLTLHSPLSATVPIFRSADPVIVRLKFTASERLVHVRFEVSFYSSDGRLLYATLESTGDEDIRPPGGVVEFVVPSLPLQPGAYYVGAVARDARTSHAIDWWDGGSRLYVDASGRTTTGHVHVPHSVRIHLDDVQAPSSVFNDRGR
jgi:ABC-type polysaccharide/polyol phosphate transport system ATPase subunit